MKQQRARAFRPCATSIALGFLVAFLAGASPAGSAPVSVDLQYTFVGIECFPGPEAAGPSNKVLQPAPTAVVTSFVIDDSLLETGTPGFTNDFSDLLDFELVVSNIAVPTKGEGGVAKQTTTTTFTEEDLTEWIFEVGAGGEILDINFFMWDSIMVGPAKSDDHRGYRFSLQRDGLPAKVVNEDGFSIEGQEVFLLGVYFGDETDRKQQLAIPVGCFSGEVISIQPVQQVPVLSGRGMLLLALLLAAAGVVAIHRRSVL